MRSRPTTYRWHRLPTASVRRKKNSVVTPNDEGLWSIVTVLGELQRRYYDPVGNTADYFGLLEESGEPAVVALRLNVENRMITEAEWHIGCEGDAGITGEPGGCVFNVEDLMANPPNVGDWNWPNSDGQLGHSSVGLAPLSGRPL